MHPMTPMISSGLRSLSFRSSPSFEKTLSSAFSRIAQVLKDQVGVVFVLGELVALGREEARHALRVVLVHLTAIRNEVKLCHELFEKSGRCVDLTVASAIREVNLARKHSQGGRDTVRSRAPPAQSVFGCGRDG